jgi:hypothetical protein
MPRDKSNDLDAWIDQACDNDVPPAEVEVVDDEVVSPLSTNEVPKAHDDLAMWRCPADFCQAVVGLHKRCRSRDLFNDPKMQFLRDAWVLAEFVECMPVDQVRLADRSERWPDGYVRVGNETKKIEITSANLPGRRLGNEYKFSGKPELDPVDNWMERAGAIPGALEKAISAKVAKRYGSAMWLIVYLNINEYGIQQAEVERAIIEIKHRHSASFEGLHVLWKSELL